MKGKGKRIRPPGLLSSEKLLPGKAWFFPFILKKDMAQSSLRENHHPPQLPSDPPAQERKAAAIVGLVFMWVCAALTLFFLFNPDPLYLPIPILLGGAIGYGHAAAAQKIRAGDKVNRLW